MRGWLYYLWGGCCTRAVGWGGYCIWVDILLHKLHSEDTHVDQNAPVSCTSIQYYTPPSPAPHHPSQASLTFTSPATTSTNSDSPHAPSSTPPTASTAPPPSASYSPSSTLPHAPSSSPLRPQPKTVRPTGCGCGGIADGDRGSRRLVRGVFARRIWRSERLLRRRRRGGRPERLAGVSVGGYAGNDANGTED
jgi:hypothetical protein